MSINKEADKSSGEYGQSYIRGRIHIAVAREMRENIKITGASRGGGDFGGKSSSREGELSFLRCL